MNAPGMSSEDALRNFQEGFGKGEPTGVVFADGQLQLVYEGDDTGPCGEVSQEVSQLDVEE